jgi:hypothetical protein
MATGHVVPCAHLEERGQCGYASSGAEKWVINDQRHKAVTATVRESWQVGIKTQQEDHVADLAPAEQRMIGCTVGQTGTTHTFKLVGCTIIP